MNLFGEESSDIVEQELFKSSTLGAIEKLKSELKIIEAGAKYKPFIGTDAITYSRTNANIDLCKTEDDWVESIKELVLNKTLRIELGKELGEYVREEYVIEKENEKRLSIL